MNLDNNNWEKLTMGLLIATIFIVGFNAYQIYKLNNSNGNQNSDVVSDRLAIGDDNMNGVSDTAISLEGPDIIPKGMPDIYGKELGVSFDDVSLTDQQKSDATIKKIGILDSQISLNSDQSKRYINIAGKISCEYCCGTESIIFPDGKAACGCAHSFAMRGLAKYLVKNHPNEFTDDQILEELGKWKTLFFPGKLTEKAKILKEKGIELNYINLASNKYRDIENKVGYNGGQNGER